MNEPDETEEQVKREREYSKAAATAQITSLLDDAFAASCDPAIGEFHFTIPLSVEITENPHPTPVKMTTTYAMGGSGVNLNLDEAHVTVEGISQQLGAEGHVTINVYDLLKPVIAFLAEDARDTLAVAEHNLLMFKEEPF